MKSHFGYPLQPTNRPLELFCNRTVELHFGHSSNRGCFIQLSFESCREKSFQVLTVVSARGRGTPLFASVLFSNCFEKDVQNFPITLIQSSDPAEISSNSASNSAVKPKSKYVLKCAVRKLLTIRPTSVGVKRFLSKSA